MSEAETDRRTDHVVRNAVDNIQTRFLERVGDRVVRGLSQRELGEELIIEALHLTEASYGCVMRQDDHHRLVLDAVVSLDKAGEVFRQHDTLLNTQPDELFQDVIDALKPSFSNEAHSMVSANLPSCHPPLRSFTLNPVHESGSLKTLLFVANATQRFDLVLVNRLQNMLDAFIRVHINSIVSRGINTVMADVGSTNRQLITLLEASFNGVVTLNENLSITAFNPACERLFNADIATTLNKDASLFFTQATLALIREKATSFHQTLHTHDARPYKIQDVELIKSDSELFPAQLSVFHSRLGDKVFTTIVIEDLSDRRQSAKQLQSTRVQYKTLTKLAPVGIIKLNQDWLCDYANDMWCQLSGRNLEQNLQSGWIEAIDEAHHAQTLMDMRSALFKGDTFRQVVKLKRHDEKTIWASVNAKGMTNSLKELTGSLIVVMDVTEQYLAEQRLTQMAHHDALTGLLNRTRFLEHLHHALEVRKPHGIVALLFIDLDGFKAVNDTLGHDAGDELLQQVAMRLRETVREDDTIARLGGDEFTVTLCTLDRGQDSSLVADSIVHAIKQPFLLQHEEVYVSASVGIALATGSTISTASDANSLIKQADVALYRAKLSGRSRHVFFTPELDQAQRDRSVLITTLRRAVDRQDFELYYQPQLLIREQTLLGFEALLRWPQPNANPMNPGEFIDVLEETGLISELGEWAISQACGQHRIWLRKGLIGPATTMSVNVSARQLGMPQFTDRVAAILERHSMRPDSLILEITESSLVQHIETDIIKHIKNLGVQISLDDFGTGYSSLAYLSQLPLDHLKIDRSFIADIGRYQHATTVIKSIIALANTLGIRVIAEGVENGDVLPLLDSEGCEGYQGYHFSKPLPAREMATLLEKLNTVRLSHYANFIDLDATSSRG